MPWRSAQPELRSAVLAEVVHAAGSLCPSRSDVVLGPAEEANVLAAGCDDATSLAGEKVVLEGVAGKLGGSRAGVSGSPRGGGRPGSESSMGGGLPVCGGRCRGLGFPGREEGLEGGPAWVSGPGAGAWCATGLNADGRARFAGSGHGPDFVVRLPARVAPLSGSICPSSECRATGHSRRSRAPGWANFLGRGVVVDVLAVSPRGSRLGALSGLGRVMGPSTAL